MIGERVVLDASALVDLLLQGPTAAWVEEHLQSRTIHAPAHMPAEVLSALGRIHRAGHGDGQHMETLLRETMNFPVAIEPIGPLLFGAWNRREAHALPDALYVELAARLDTVVITTDRRLAWATPLAEAPPG